MTARILVLGAGIAGLATAWWLKHKGFAPVVVERAPSLREDGFVLSLGGTGFTVAERMGILDELRNRNVNLGRTLFRDSRGRDVLLVDHSRHLHNLNLLPVCRDDLVQALYQAVEGDVEVRFGRQLQSHVEDDEGVDVTFDDGSQERFAYVVGAEGCFSDLRRRAFASDEACLRSLGYNAASFIVEGDMAPGGEQHLSFSEPGYVVECYNMRPGLLATLWLWHSDDTRRIAPPQRKARLRETFANAHPDVLKVLEPLPEDRGFYLDHLMQVHLPQWHKGRLVLVGDAAHCLTLASGRGASMALTGAWLLADELARDFSPAALPRYEAALRPDIVELQALAKRMSGWYAPITRRGWHLRNWAMRLMPARLSAWLLRRTFDKLKKTPLAMRIAG
ncbi:FAD-dependent monooxygenase [Pseudomonas sp. LRF_L74]|uniref:FAD-dependent monooxygenase n=1 Tax=Pseudomonas sp. LRF_L74 TaxID=3369422 RepID=UPI003F5EAA7F